jgi:adenylate kinase
MISSPSKKYLIEGFPSTVEQAHYFENNVFEAHHILYYDLPKDHMYARMTKRAETSGNRDYNQDQMRIEVQNYFD